MTPSESRREVKMRREAASEEAHEQELGTIGLRYGGSKRLRLLRFAMACLLFFAIACLLFFNFHSGWWVSTGRGETVHAPGVEQPHELQDMHMAKSKLSAAGAKIGALKAQLAWPRKAPPRNSTGPTQAAAAPEEAAPVTEEAAAAPVNSTGPTQWLKDVLRCSTTPSNGSQTMVNFFATATHQQYEDFLPMYAFCALSSHQPVGGGSTVRSVVEMVVTNPEQFIERHNAALAWMLEMPWGGNSSAASGPPICVRNYSADHSKRTRTTNTWRFLEVPSQPAKYTYIGDVDVFITSSVLDPRRMQQMEHFGLPYSNIIRAGENYPRLTGVMLVKTENFYTHKLVQAQRVLDARGNDEHFLYRLVVAAGMETPPKANSVDKWSSYRPLHGIHLSLNRGPGKRLCLPSNETLNTLFSLARIESYLNQDRVGKDFLYHFSERISKQQEGKMVNYNGTCQAPIVVEKVNSKVEVLTKLPLPLPLPLLVFEVGIGLHNQLMSFIDAVVVAQLYHFDVVLPTMWGSANPMENKSRPMDWGELYDAPYFEDCMLRSIGLRVFRKLPPGQRVRKLKIEWDGAKTRKVNEPNELRLAFEEGLRVASGRQGDSGLSPTAVDIGRWYARWSYLRSDAKSFAHRRVVFKCLRPSQAISLVVSKVVDGLRAKFPSGYTSIHPRLEHDWQKLCGITNRFDCWVNTSEWASRLTDLSSKPSHYEGLYLMSGAAHIDLSPFWKKNFSLVTKHNFTSPEDLSNFRYPSSFAAIDFFVALASDMVYGFFYSSMDIVLWEARLYTCQPMGCIHSTLGSNWFKVVSSWTRSFFFYRLDDVLFHYNQSSSGIIGYCGGNQSQRLCCRV